MINVVFLELITIRHIKENDSLLLLVKVSSSKVCFSCDEQIPADVTLCPYCGFNNTGTQQRQPTRGKRKGGYNFILKGRYLFSNPYLAVKKIEENPDRLGPILILMLAALVFAIQLLVILRKTGASLRLGIWTMTEGEGQDAVTSPTLLDRTVGGLSVLALLTIVSFVVFYATWNILSEIYIQFIGIGQKKVRDENRVYIQSVTGYGLIYLLISQVISLPLILLVGGNDQNLPNTEFIEEMTGSAIFTIHIILIGLGWICFTTFLVMGVYKMGRATLISVMSIIFFVPLIIGILRFAY